MLAGGAGLWPGTAAREARTVYAVQAEQMAARQSHVFGDRTASHGRGMRLWGSGSLSRGVSTAGADALVVRARADPCRGAPKMRISLDRTAVATRAVRATAWHDYIVHVPVRPGHHELAIALVNGRVRRGACARGLLIDDSRLIATTPPPARPLWSTSVDQRGPGDWSQDGGGGEFNSGNANSTPTTAVHHSGEWSVQQTWRGPSTSGTRLFRWKELQENRELIMSAWLYIPVQYSLTGPNGWLNLFELKSANADDSCNDPMYAVYARVVDGRLHGTLGWGQQGCRRLGPHKGQYGWFTYGDVVLPVGHWFQLKMLVRQSRGFDGRVVLWRDNDLVAGLDHVRTGYSDCTHNRWCTNQGWSVNLYSDGLSPRPSVTYVDDAMVARPYAVGETSPP